LSDTELDEVKATIAQWRSQLSNISRFMGHLNQSIARRAKKEDKCKGRFWESRFKLQAILDFRALLRTLCYVDLNPVRARIAKRPDSSLFISVRRATGELHTSVYRSQHPAFHLTPTDSVVLHNLLGKLYPELQGTALSNYSVKSITA